MVKEKNLCGQIFGELTVLHRDQNSDGKKRRTKWLCRCSCGVITSIFTHNLTGGRSERCNDWVNHPRSVRPPTSECTVQDNVVIVQCSDGTLFTVDATDLHIVQNRSWYITSSGYVYANIKGKKCSVHRILLNADEFDEIDHISGDKLDNRRVNLRFCTHAENQRNMKKRANNKTGYKGVFIAAGKTKYMAQIRINGKNIYLGSYDTSLEAAQAYNSAAEMLHGSFSRLNNVPPSADNLTQRITNKLNRLITGGFIMSETG